MTEPQPSRQPDPAPGPPQPPEPPQDPPAGPPDPGKPEPDAKPAGPELEAALREERRARADLQKQLDELRQAQMSEQERAVAQARAEGKAEAASEAARKLAAAEFRHSATGRIADPAAALELLDVGKLLKNGEPDSELIAAVIDRLAPPEPDPGANGNGYHAPPARVPAGPRQPAPDGDFLRQAMRGRR